MHAVPFEIKSEVTETDRSSTIDNSVHELETNISDDSLKALKKRGGPRSKYGKPTKENREELIHKITHEGVSIRQAAKKVGINYSTAKSIFNLYKSEGRLGNDLFRDEEEEVEKNDTAMGVIFAGQLPQKKVFQSQEEVTIKKKDPFTCLLFQQLNTVESKPRGFFSTDCSGSQSKSLLSSAFCIYQPQNNFYPNAVIAQNNRESMHQSLMMNVIYMSDSSRPNRF